MIIKCMIMSIKQRKRKIKPRIKLNHNTYVFQGVKFAVSSPERLEYTAEHSLISTPRTDKKEMEKNVAQKIGKL